MMQQMSAASQGMFPMMNPALWNIPMGQWPQFFSQVDPLMTQHGQGGLGSVPASASQSSSIGGQGTGQQQNAGNKIKKKQPSVSVDAIKKNPEKGVSLSSGPVLDPKFKDVICFNYGEPGHYVGLCTRLKRCFMCGRTGHHMDTCSLWYQPMPTAQYWGSANPGLGFFHIDVEGPAGVQWLNMDNVGIVVVNEGSITESELEQNFCEMWKVNWFWQIRQIVTGRFLVRFPPSKKIKELVDYPSINLKKKG
jgi:hypothetical protein